ncbi:iron-sulfur cluster-binding protein [Plectosphaerella plurivora]|uniref:Choline monooxygenase, chloroplastic n=1 Tax=Plectosphaerella plurivora TaxID=936078 RepID=A0A9P8VNP6_9PEZI|nr:iron-sulfur cluster-binding protein [Plectosphaerella plurivora]
MSWFGIGRPANAEAEAPTTARALPAVWYRSPGMYELERRSIFSKRWILVSHSSRFVKTGDFAQITEAGFNFFLVKDRQGKIQGHHNVCRHRAYPLVEKESGHMNILACKYHGWSYGFDGRLAKAPKYQEVPSFDKTENNLFKVHAHTDHLGFIWVNLDSAEEPEIPWAKFFGAVDQQPRLQQFNMSEYHFDHGWDMMGDYNWKTLADNYNECYHCPTGHPAVNSISDLSKYWVETDGNWIQHFNVDKENTDGMGIYSTFYYPNTSMTVSKDFMYIMRCNPVSATKTKMEYEVYRHKDATEEDFNGISEFFKQVLREDKDLCNGAQKNLNMGIFVNGELHPRVEKGPLFFQTVTRELVTSHKKTEEKLGSEIWPAAPKQKLTGGTQEDIMFCQGLDCNDGQGDQGVLAW